MTTETTRRRKAPEWDIRSKARKEWLDELVGCLGGKGPYAPDPEALEKTKEHCCLLIEIGSGTWTMGALFEVARGFYAGYLLATQPEKYRAWYNGDRMKKYTAEEAKRIWLISDTHFDHTNIIRYCDRPFYSVQVMNQVLLRNWNGTVAPGGVVYFVGDMTFGKHHRKAGYWLRLLNGKKIFIRGSHDRRSEIVGDSVLKVADMETIQVEGVPFLLIHDPFSPAVNGWDGWIIHGHIHNLPNYKRPFIDGRMINVNVETTGYKPISLYEIWEIVRSA